VCGAVEVRRVLVVGGGRAGASAAWLAGADFDCGELRSLPLDTLCTPKSGGRLIRGQLRLLTQRSSRSRQTGTCKLTLRGWGRAVVRLITSNHRRGE
jgi:hypothetical protein